MATVTIPLLNMRHNGPRGVGAAGLPLKALRQFQVPPPDLLAAEKKKLEAEKVKLVKELRTGAPGCCVHAAASAARAARAVCAADAHPPARAAQTRTSTALWACR